MKVPLLDLEAQLQTIDQNVKAAVNDVIDSTRYIMGPKVEELEAKIAEYAADLFWNRWSESSGISIMQSSLINILRCQ